MVKPPALLIDNKPSAPSLPIPVKIIPICLLPKIWVADKNIESIDDKLIEDYHFDSNFEKILNFKKTFDNNLLIFKQFSGNIRDYYSKCNDDKYTKNLINIMEINLNIKKSKFTNEELIELKENIPTEFKGKFDDWQALKDFHNL